MWQTIFYICVKHSLPQRCTYPRCQVAWATKLCMQLPNICGSSEWNLFHVTLLASTILRWFLKPCGPWATSKLQDTTFNSYCNITEVQQRWFTRNVSLMWMEPWLHSVAGCVRLMQEFLHAKLHSVSFTALKALEIKVLTSCYIKHDSTLKLNGTSLISVMS